MNILDSINKELKKTHPYGDIMDDANYNKITDYIDTGNYMLNMAMSGSFFRGIPNNTICAIAGPSAVGKTFLLLNIYKNALDKGYNVYHFDTEGALNEDTLRSFGLYDYWHTTHKPSERDNKLYVIPIGIIEKFTNLVTIIIDNLMEEYKCGKEVPKVMLGCDSLGNLASTKEYEDARSGSNKVDMTAAKKIKSFFRIITIPCSVLKIPVLFTNHVYASTDMYGEDKMSKGSGLQYCATSILYLSKAQLKNKKTGKKTGIKVLAKLVKSRLTKPSVFRFHIHFKQGMNKFVGLTEYIDGFKKERNIDTPVTLGWDDIGIGKGKFIAEIKSLPVLDDDGNEVKKTNGEVKYKKQETGVLLYESRGREICVEHLGRTVTPRELLSELVFTDDLLRELENKIKHTFVYGIANDNDEEYDSE